MNVKHLYKSYLSLLLISSTVSLLHLFLWYYFLEGPFSIYLYTWAILFQCETLWTFSVWGPGFFTSLCVCTFVCVWLHMYIHVELRRQFLCWFSTSTLFETRFLCCLLYELSEVAPRASADSPVCAFHLTLGSRDNRWEPLLPDLCGLWGWNLGPFIFVTNKWPTMPDLVFGFLRQDLTMQSKLTWNSLHSPG